MLVGNANALCSEKKERHKQPLDSSSILCYFKWEISFTLRVGFECLNWISSRLRSIQLKKTHTHTESNMNELFFHLVSLLLFLCNSSVHSSKWKCLILDFSSLISVADVCNLDAKKEKNVYVKIVRMREHSCVRLIYKHRCSTWSFDGATKFMRFYWYQLFCAYMKNKRCSHNEPLSYGAHVSATTDFAEWAANKPRTHNRELYRYIKSRARKCSSVFFCCFFSLLARRI